ncbi:hypothetical protein SDC9_45299 [bioreactor metagenome]|uniref:Uncharacterized protein n=1 Tax=bioreactor metagenome TaxID=1076179 RepID=A0A644W5M6_9ZZZZ
MKKFIFLVTLIMFCNLIFGQDKDGLYSIEKNEIKYSIGSKNIEIISYTIRNLSNDLIILWFDKDSIRDIELKTRLYFHKKKGDISLFGMITDPNLRILSFDYILFYSFFKVIKENDTFSIQFLCDSLLKEEQIKRMEDFINKYLTVVPSDYLIKSTNNYNIYKSIDFKCSSIIIPINILD